MSKPYTPQAYTGLALNHLTGKPRCNLWAMPGSGKTALTMTAVDNQAAVAAVYPAIVFAPKRVARRVWSDEGQKWDHLAHLRVSNIVGDVAQRQRALLRDAEWYTINYENIPWLRKYLGPAWPFQTGVPDEATRLKNFRIRQGGSRAQALRDVAFKCQQWYNLTGSPSPNGLKDLWGQNWFVDQGQRLGRTFGAFQERWFQAVPGGDGYSQIRPLAHADKEIRERLLDVSLTIDPRDYYDIKEPIVADIYVDLTGRAEANYRTMAKQFFAELASGAEVEAFNSGAKSIKCLQIANGFAFTDREGGFEDIHDEKLDALEEIMDETGGAPVLAAYHFKPDLARLLRRFPYARQIVTTQDEKDWDDGKIRLGLAHPASMGHGLSLQDGGNILVYYSHWWDAEQREQILERIGPVRQMQAGHDRPVFVYNIIARGTMDQTVIDRHTSKMSVQDALKNAMKEFNREKS